MRNVNHIIIRALASSLGASPDDAEAIAEDTSRRFGHRPTDDPMLGYEIVAFVAQRAREDK